MRHLWLALTLALVACNPDEETDTNETDTQETDTVDTDPVDTDEPVVCGEIPPDVCDAELSCRSIKGFSVVTDGEGGYCVDQEGLPSRIGCISKEVDCSGEQVKWGRPPGADDTVCFRILQSCMPRDYVPCAEAMRVTDECPAT